MKSFICPGNEVVLHICFCRMRFKEEVGKWCGAKINEFMFLYKSKQPILQLLPSNSDHSQKGKEKDPTHSTFRFHYMAQCENLYHK